MDKLRPTQTIALLILNPNSRMGREADLAAGIASLEKAGMKLIQKSSRSPSDTGQIIDDLHHQVNLVILGGGDGTISAAAAALYRHKLRFAILPLGTANDLARSLGMSMDLAEAFNNILENKPHRVNLGLLNSRYFFNAAHIGLGVDVTRALTPEIKRKLGVFSYLQAVFVALQKNRSFRARITVDGKDTLLHSIQIAVGNGRYYGGGNVIDENSTIDDGRLCLYSLPPLRFWELLAMGPLLRQGKQRQTESTFCASGKEIEINTLPPRSIHADGEPAGKTPAVFKVIPRALEVICPKPQHPDD